MKLEQDRYIIKLYVKKGEEVKKEKEEISVIVNCRSFDINS